MKIGNVKPAFLAIASAPTVARKGRLEFLIKDIEGSTAGMICSVRKGDKVELSQVMGSGFPTERIFPAEENKTVLLFATGSGIRYTEVHNAVLFFYQFELTIHIFPFESPLRNSSYILSNY